MSRDSLGRGGGQAIPGVGRAASELSRAAVKESVSAPLAAPAETGQGLTLHPDGSASFRVWAPHATAVSLQLEVLLSLCLSSTSRAPLPDPLQYAVYRNLYLSKDMPRPLS